MDKFEIRNAKFEKNRCRGGAAALLTLLLAGAGPALAQSASPAASVPAGPTVMLSPAPSAPQASAAPAASPSPTPGATPSLLKKTGVKIQFLPPPMEGTISLGIYDPAGKLVRVLHREASGDEFVAALDGYITHWDGLDDAGHPLPPGHYSARGYMVGAVTVKAVPAPGPALAGTSAAASPTPQAGSLGGALPTLKFPDGTPFVQMGEIHTGLVPNPLDQDRAGSADLSAGYDSKGSWLELADGLPLKRISATPNLKWVALGRSAPGQPLVLFQGDGAKIEEFLITKVSDMMAFDCGPFDFSGQGN